ncbi:MAG: iron-containing redox enzyme family protein [Elusimicrobia bacterium]|nr:iron-containing redox enzyme family protein [Elusimicrobiota bacterium]
MKSDAYAKKNTKLAGIHQCIEFYRKELQEHPLGSFIEQGRLPREIAQEFALYLFADSWQWPPMLTAMRGRVQNTKLREAIWDNILDETGAQKDSHVTLCLEFLESLGIPASLDSGPNLNGTISIARRLSEAQIAGWLLAAEELTLDLFRLARKQFERTPGGDLRYIDEHLEADIEHSRWLWESAESLLNQRPCLKEILCGVGLGSRATLEVLDKLFEKALASAPPCIKGQVLLNGHKK